MPSERCPFGSHLQRYWDRLSPLERQMKLDDQALYSLTPQVVARQIAAATPGKHLVDAFCGAGGLTIALAREGKQVLAIDLDGDRLEMARHNAALFDVAERIKFRQGDCLQLLPSLTADAVLLDPPWGGVDYGLRPRFGLSDFSPDGRRLLGAALAVAPQVVMRLPRNFDFEELPPLGLEYRLQENLYEGRLLHYCVYFGRGEIAAP